MSLNATRWAWMQRGLSASQRCTLLSLADRANEDHVCYPSLKRIAFDTEQDIKTIRKAIKSLCDKGLLSKQERSGTSSLYTLVGVEEWKSSGSPTPTVNGTPPHSGGGKTVASIPQQKPTPLSLKKEQRQSFDECWKIYPVKQGQESAWRKWKALARAGALPDSRVICDAIIAHSQTDSRWKRGKIPLMKNWLTGKRWMDQPHDEAEATQPSYQDLPLWRSPPAKADTRGHPLVPAWEGSPANVTKGLTHDVLAALRGDTGAKARMAARAKNCQAPGVGA